MQPLFSVNALRAILIPTVIGVALCQVPVVQAQFTPIEVEQAPSLSALVSQLGAQAAQPSSYLELDLPDVTLVGEVRAKALSTLPGTSTLVLVRGQYVAASATPSANLAPPPTLARPKGGAEAAKAPPPPVWLASASYKAGDTPVLVAKFKVERTEYFTLFAHAQGRWWFVTREIKIGAPPAGTPASAAGHAHRASHRR